MKVCLECKHLFNGSEWKCAECAATPSARDGIIIFAPDQAEVNDGFESESFERLIEIEDGNYWFEARASLLSWALQEYFPSAQCFMEIGCGTGFNLSRFQQRFPQLSLVGSEIYNEGLNFAKERLSVVELFQMDARKIPYANEFDVIGAFDVLEHIEEDELVLGQMFQATKPGGGVMITVPQHPRLWSYVDEYSFHKRRYKRRELIQKVQQAGFSVLRTTSFVSILLPIMILSRFKKKVAKEDWAPCNELHVNRFANSLLASILNLEKLSIEHGVSFPFGGSLLLIAKRGLE